MTNDKYAVDDFVALNRRLKEIEAKQEIDTSDIPEATEAWFKEAKAARLPLRRRAMKTGE